MQKYMIVEKQVKAINFLIKIIQTSIERKSFSEDELKMIYKSIDILNQDYTRSHK